MLREFQGLNAGLHTSHRTEEGPSNSVYIYHLHFWEQGPHGKIIPTSNERLPEVMLPILFGALFHTDVNLVFRSNLHHGMMGRRRLYIFWSPTSRSLPPCVLGILSLSQSFSPAAACRLAGTAIDKLDSVFRAVRWS